MNFNRIFLISFLVLMLSSYQSYSSILFTLMMKLLMIKGALFMSMPLGIGAFVMGQGMGFFAGNMMGGYMMLRAANRYHNKEKSRWVTHSGWHGPPYNSLNYNKGYQTGKGIVTAINLGQQKFKSIGNIIKAFVPSPPPKYGPPKYGPPPPVKYGPPDYSPFPPSPPISYGSYSNPPPSVSPPGSSYGAPPEPSYGLPPPMSNYGPPPPNYGPPPPPSYGAPGDMYHSATGVPMSYHDYMPSAGRKNAFSNSLLNSVGGGGGSMDLLNKLEQEKNRRIHNEIAPMVSPSGFYTSAYGTPGQEFTGILTNEPTKQGDKYLRGEADHSKEDDMNTASASSTKPTVSSVTSPPNEILESYLEQRLKTEAEKQKDEERKQETQQLIQMLRKAYIKQLVNSIKEEEVAEKEKANRRLDTLSSPSASPFANLISSSIENLLGSRESRSIEQQNNNHHDPEANVRQRSMDLIRDFLINEVFTSDEQQQEQSTSNKVNPLATSLENIDTVEVESITERILSLTSTEREELVKGLDNLGQEQEETTLSKPIEGDNDNSALFTSSSSSSSTENSLGTSTEVDGVKKRDVRGATPVSIDGAEWIPIDSHTYNSDQDLPFGVRLKRQTESLTPPSPNAEEQKQIQSFVDDIRKFFTLLSALDQDQCLQKLVCDVHTNEKDISTLTQYEINILTTFKLMKALMPEGEEDSSTKYRYAALLGETGQSMDLCQQQYTSCQVSSNQIVQLGSAEPQQNTQDTSNPLMMNLANLEQQSQAAAAMAGMNAGSPTTLGTTTSTSTTTTTSTTTSTTVRPRRIRTRMTTTTPLPTLEIENTQRRNYVESNQYHMDQQRRRHQQQQYFHSQDQHNQQYQYGNHNQRPQQQFHGQRPSASASHSTENRASAEGGGPSSNFFNYGEFSDYFRSMWSDTMMGNAAGGRGKRRRGQLKPQSQESYNHYWPGEVVEEIGI